jgi:uncharacterized protein (TIGR03083 family)
MTDPHVIEGVPIPDLGGAYRGVRERTTALVRDTSPAQLAAIAPATPEWRVRDVLAHMVGVPADVLAGRLEGVASDAWTAAQVDRYRDADIDAMLDEWADTSEQVEPMIPDFGVMAGQAITDVATHEHDIRHALGAAGARDSDAVLIGSVWMAQWMAKAYTDAGDGPLRIETDLWAHTYGEGEPGTTLRVPAFELLRAGTGRRSAEQIEAFAWEGPARVDAVVMPIFTPRAEAFVG